MWSLLARGKREESDKYIGNWGPGIQNFSLTHAGDIMVDHFTFYLSLPSLKFTICIHLPIKNIFTSDTLFPLQFIELFIIIYRFSFVFQSVE